MGRIQKLLDNNSEEVYPVTHEKAVMDSDGTDLESKLTVLKNKTDHITFVSQDTEEEVVEFQTNGGSFIAKVDVSGIEATDVKARIGSSAVSLTGLYKDPMNSESSTLSFGDTNGKNLVVFDEGHVKTKFFDSREAATGVLADKENTEAGSLAFGDANGKDIVQFAEGHVRTKNFDSREAAVGIYKDADDTNAASLCFGDTNGKNIVIFSEGHVKTKYFNSEQVVNDIADLKSQGAGVNDKRQRLMEFNGDYYSYKYGKVPSGNSYNWYERARLLHFSDNHANLANLTECIGLKDLVHLVIDTGDNANAAQGAYATSPIEELTAYVNTIGDTSIPIVVTSGNHDVPTMTAEAYYNIMGALMASKNGSNYHFGDASHYRCYGYIDITPNATVGTIRVINLDPADYNDGDYWTVYGSQNTTYACYGAMNCVFSQAQINWFINTLKDAANNGYKVITMMHYAFGDKIHTNNPATDEPYTEDGSPRADCNFHQDPYMIPDIIDAMQHPKPLSKTYEDDSGEQDIVINEDFSSLAHPLDYICHLFGHIHSENEYQCQKKDGTKFYDMLLLGAPSMGASMDTGRVLNKVPKQPDTLNSIKLTVLEIDTVSQDIYRVNYGAYKAFDMSETERTKKIHYRFQI